jgi:hypothetical protein
MIGKCDCWGQSIRVFLSPHCVALGAGLRAVVASKRARNGQRREAPPCRFASHGPVNQSWFFNRLFTDLSTTILSKTCHLRGVLIAERYFRRYTTVVSVSAGSGVGSP